MKNRISKKIIASLMLMSFAFTNSITMTYAVENVGLINPVQAGEPVLRDSQEDSSMKLRGDVTFIKSNPLVTLSLRDSDVKQVLRMFADKAGMNIVFHNSVSGTVTLDLVNVPLNRALEMVMEINDLNFAVDNDTIIVAKTGTKGFNFAKQDMTLIPVKYVGAAALADFLNKNIFAMHKPGLSDQDIVTTNPVTNELIVFGSKADVAIAKKIVEKFDKKPQTTVFEVNHTTPAEMAEMICSMLLPAATGATSGKGSGGGSATGGAASAGGSGIALNSGTVACTLEGQISGSVSSLGLQNMTVAYYPQLGTINIIGGSEHQIEMIKDFIAETDKKQQQAYLEIAIIELNENGIKDLQNNWSLLSKSFSASFNGETTGTDPLHPVFLKGNGYKLVTVKDGKIEEQYDLGKWDGPLTISYAINYLIKNSKGRVVSNPRIMITNGEESTIDITEDYIESTESEQSAYAGGSIATRTYNIADDAGIKVAITPFISNDGYVTMNIKPEYSTILRQETTQDSIGPYVAATLLSHRNLDLKNVRIKDGETLVIAGMISEMEEKVVGKVPVLGDLPVIGTLFRNTHNEKTKNEMVIMITPKIVTDTEDAVGNPNTL